MLLQGLRLNPEQVDFTGVAVGDDSAGEVRRGAGSPGELGAEHAAGAGLGEGDGLVALQEEFTHALRAGLRLCITSVGVLKKITRP